MMALGELEAKYPFHALYAGPGSFCSRLPKGAISSGILYSDSQLSILGDFSQIP
jgi:hypothetical protein